MNGSKLICIIFGTSAVVVIFTYAIVSLITPESIPIDVIEHAQTVCMSNDGLSAIEYNYLMLHEITCNNGAVFTVDSRVNE